MRRSTSASLLIALTGLVACSGREDPERWRPNVEAFRAEVEELRRALDVPGLAFAVVSHGEVLHSEALGTVAEGSADPFATDTPLRVASLTKALAAVVALQLVEEGRLDLYTPVRGHVAEADLPDSVEVRHLLTHTSEGVVGREYVYGSTRYRLVGRVIEAVTGRTFPGELRVRVLDRADMRWYPSPGLDAHGGLVSTVDDLARFTQALDRGRLLGRKSLEQLARPSLSRDGRPLPVSLGWFAQRIQGVPVVWSFGQDEPEHSGALLLRVPHRGWSLVLLANRNTVSDPFRLLMGDVRRSPFAMAFFRLFVASAPGRPLRPPPWDDPDLAEELRQREAETEYGFGDELIGRALVRLWRGDRHGATALLDLGVDHYELAQRPDPVVHFAALRLDSDRWKQMAVVQGERLVAAHPGNRWILLTQGYLLQQTGSPAAAAALFERILALPEQEPDALHLRFEAWSRLALAEIHAAGEPERARAHLDRVLHAGVGDELRAEAERLLGSLDGEPPATAR